MSLALVLSFFIHSITFFLLLAGRYQVRVVSLESPDIQTHWQDIVVGKFIYSIRYSIFVTLSVICLCHIRFFFLCVIKVYSHSFYSYLHRIPSFLFHKSKFSVINEITLVIAAVADLLILLIYE